jgi:uncharacterized protein (TIGR03437 family)
MLQGRLILITMLALAAAARADLSGINPAYTASGIVNAATQLPGGFAPNSIATLYGSDLSFTTHALTPAELDRFDLPLSLEGVTVYVNGQPANLFYVSPGQINFLIPYEITTSTATVSVLRNSTAGPKVTIPLAVTSPAFFQWNGNLAVAEHVDGSLVSPDAPAHPGDVIVLFAAGLGRTSSDMSSGYIPRAASSILYLSQLRVLLNGTACPASRILYAGVTPGFAGLYQINLRLPDDTPSDPEIRVSIGEQISPASIQLPVR